jgi:hypothetical protein
VAHAPFLLVLGTLQLLIVLIAFAVVPQFFTHHFWSYVGLLAALGGCLPVAIPAVQSFQRRA